MPVARRFVDILRYRRVILLLLGLIILISGFLAPSLLFMRLESSTQKSRHSVQFEVIELRPAARSLEQEGANLIQKRIVELERLRTGVRNELRSLEKRRQEAQRRTQAQVSSLESARSEYEKVAKETIKSQRELRSVKMALNRANAMNARGLADAENVMNEERGIAMLPDQLVEALPPKRIILPSGLESSNPLPSRSSSQACGMTDCFDYSRCSLTAPFLFYVYPKSAFLSSQSSLFDIIYQYLTSQQQYTSKPEHACLYVIISTHQNATGSGIEKLLHGLPSWQGDGRNHILLDIVSTLQSSQLWKDLNIGRAILAQTFFPTPNLYRPGFDIIVPPVFTGSRAPVLVNLPNQLPAFRKYLLYFRGEFTPRKDSLKPRTIADDLTALKDRGRGQLFISTTCGEVAHKNPSHPGEWALCGTSSQRLASLYQSTYSLILSSTPPVSVPFSSHPSISAHIRLIEALQSGAIPVIVADGMPLPFNNVIDWSEAAVILPEARITEINFVLHAVSESDLLRLRWQGRFLWETYFSTAFRIVDTAIANVRSHIGLPPPAIPDPKTSGVFEGGNTRPNTVQAIDNGIALPLSNVDVSSPQFQHNFSTSLYQQWNWPPGALIGLPSVTPFSPTPPSGFQYIGPGRGQHLHPTVQEGGPMNGPEFEVVLSGNVPDEQFTVVLLTYDRNEVLIAAVQRLQHLQYLRSVIVVWNNPEKPPDSMMWPDIGVPVHVS